MATYKLLDSYTVGAGGVSSVTFSSIPQTYSDLKIVVSARANGSSNWQIGVTQFNTDTTAGNYPSVILYGYNGTRGGQTANQWGGGYVPNSTQTANTFSNTETYITNYAANGVAKTISVHSIAENNAINYAPYQLTSMTWSGTAPITQIVFTPDNGSFTQYSTFYLYGVWADTSTGTPSAPTIGTATAGNTTASVAFTPAGSGNTAVYYQAISTPGSITGTGTSSPITVSGLTNNISYTFKVAGVNPIGTGTYSAASNSVTPIPASYYSVQTITVDSGGASSITFSNIPQTYKHLQVRGIAKMDSGQAMQVRFNSDSSSAYARHYLQGGAGGYGSGNAINQSQINCWLYSDSSATNDYGAFVADVLDYTNTNKYKTSRSLWGQDFNGSGYVALDSGLWQSTSAITSITLFPSGGNFTQYSTFSLYGVI